MAGEAQAAGDGRVAKSFLCPTEEDVAGCEYCGRGDDRLHHISTVIARLKVGGAIRKGEWKDTPFGYAVVGRRGSTFDRDRDVDWIYVDYIEETSYVAGYADVSATIHHLVGATFDATNRDGRRGIAPQTTHSGGAHDVCNTIWGGDEWGKVGRRRLSVGIITEVNNDKGL
jgi:hypothetical protein